MGKPGYRVSEQSRARMRAAQGLRAARERAAGVVRKGRLDQSHYSARELRESAEARHVKEAMRVRRYGRVNTINPRNRTATIEIVGHAAFTIDCRALGEQTAHEGDIISAFVVYDIPPRIADVRLLSPTMEPMS
jgi:hypothetical protein